MTAVCATPTLHASVHADREVLEERRQDASVSPNRFLNAMRMAFSVPAENWRGDRPRLCRSKKHLMPTFYGVIAFTLTVDNMAVADARMAAICRGRLSVGGKGGCMGSKAGFSSRRYVRVSHPVGWV